MRIRTFLLCSTGAVLLIATSARLAAQPTIKEVPIKPTAAISGADMFNEYCAVCHGKSGKGDGPAARALNPAPTDLTRLAAKNQGKFPDLKIASYIRGEETVAAHGTRDMPIWGKLFASIDNNKSVDQLRVANLSNYLKTLQEK